MIAYLDTSSLFKLYHQEEDSESVESIISGVELMHLSDITKLEFRSAIWKKFRTQEIDEDNAMEAIISFQNDYAKFSWVELNPEIVTAATDLLMTYGKRGLRTLDSIQLASALTLEDEECTFITSDDKLKELFQSENLNVAL